MREDVRGMGQRFRLGARISILVAAGAIAAAVGVALLLSNTIKLRDSANATIRSDAYLVAAMNVERLVVDAETGLRGYVITGRPLFLAPLRAAQANFPSTRTALQRAAARDHAFVAQADGLAQASDSYLSSYVPSVLEMMAHDPRGARSFVTTLSGKRLVDAIRSRTASLEALVGERENRRQRGAKRSATHAVTEAIVILVLLTLLTTLVGVVLGRLAASREVARRRAEHTNWILQQSLLPRAMPAVEGCELAVRFTPAGAGELVGGDFYDVFEVGPDRWAIVLGDVCGKGSEAASVTAMARWTLRSRSEQPMTPAQALDALNDQMLRLDLGVRFITIAYLLVTIEADRAQVSVACAGHPAPILVPEAGEPHAVDARGTLLGVWPDIDLHSAEVELARGDGLVAYTDGVTDQGPETQPASPSEILRDRPPGASADQLAGLLERSAHRLSGRQRDDIAILALRFTGSGEGELPEEPRALAEQAIAQGL